MPNIILNEDYKDYKILFEKGEGDKIFFKKKSGCSVLVNTSF